MYDLSGTNRCKLFELIAEYVWDDIVHHHRYDIHKPEIGITNSIVALIRSHSTTNQNFGVWANNAVNEDENGGDIDVFVETQTNEFIWYALQAKVLKRNRKYEDLSIKKQWEKLDVLKRKSGCIPFYLFYNGVYKEINTIRDCCGDIITEKQFGCGLVTTENVRGVSTKKSYPKYEDFYALMHPWRELVCCEAQRKKQYTTYNLNQISNAMSLYEGVHNSDIINSDAQLENNFENSITNLNEENDRNPTYSFVIRTTSGIKNNK